MIPRIGELSEKHNSTRLFPIESHWSPHIVTSMLKHDFFFNMSVFLSVLVPSLLRIFEAGEVELTTPITSTMVFGLVDLISKIVLK